MRGWGEWCWFECCCVAEVFWLIRVVLCRCCRRRWRRPRRRNPRRRRRVGVRGCPVRRGWHRPPSFPLGLGRCARMAGVGTSRGPGPARPVKRTVWRGPGCGCGDGGPGAELVPGPGRCVWPPGSASSILRTCASRDGSRNRSELPRGGWSPCVAGIGGGFLVGRCPSRPTGKCGASAWSSSTPRLRGPGPASGSPVDRQSRVWRRELNGGTSAGFSCVGRGVC